jgi:hypothetical protein
MEWIRAQPFLATAVLGFCVVAIGGLVMSLPRGLWSSRSAGSAHVTTPAPSVPVAKDPSESRPSGDAGPRAEPQEPGPWVEPAVPPPSSRGVSLVYRYRTLPPGGESRYEWIVQVRGPRPVLEGIEVVGWRMEPAAKNGAEFESRDRAADGFPLFGHGPGGWFGVSVTIRYRDGSEETLARRIELAD